MAVYGDKVRETSITTGTGTLNLGGAVTGFRTFVAGIGNGKPTIYTIENTAAPGEWEVGLGIVTDATPDTLSRAVIISSSNSGSAVNFSAGTKNVFVSATAFAMLSAQQLPRRVKAATTANITLSGEQTIDDISIVSGDRVLVKNQSTASQNGLYTCASGAWVRSVDCYTGDDASGQMVIIEQGTANGDQVWLCTSNSGSALVGTNNLAYVQISGGGDGDVQGPGSSTDHQLVAFDGTGGDAIEAITGATWETGGRINVVAMSRTPVALSDGATITIDWAAGDIFNVTLGGNRTIAFDNLKVGQCILFHVTQDGTGARTLTWPASVKWGGGTPPTLTTTVNRTDTFGFECKTAGGTPAVYGRVVDLDMDI